MKQVWQKIHHHGIDCLVPFEPAAEKRLADLKINEPASGNISGVRNPRSLDQLRLYWGACKVTADNTDDKHWNSKDKVDWQCRNYLKFYDYDNTYVNGQTVNFRVRSISFETLAHAEACDYFNEAFRVMADYLGVDTETFIAEVKSRFGGRCANP